MKALKNPGKKAIGCVLGTCSIMSNLLYPERNVNPLIISGSPRGGTTWIAESIASIVKTSRIMWEPLQEGNIEKNKCGFTKRPFVNEDNVTEDMDTFFKKLLNGTMVNKHTLRLEKQPEHILSFLTKQRLVIKFVRGNGVAAYLRRKYNVPKPLVIIRHPCAVVSSQLHMGNWEDHPYVNRKVLEMYPLLEQVINNDASLPERLAMTWAVDVLNAKMSKDEVQIVYYEDVVLNQGTVLKKVLEAWNIESTIEEIEQYLDRPSSSNKEWTQLDSPESKLSRWKNDLDDTTVKSVVDVVKQMGIDEYDKEALPLFLR